MTHRMILVSHDFKEVKAVVIARRKDAGMAELERSLRTGEDAGENPATGSIFEEEGDADGD